MSKQGKPTTDEIGTVLDHLWDLCFQSHLFLNESIAEKLGFKERLVNDIQDHATDCAARNESKEFKAKALEEFEAWYESAISCCNYDTAREAWVAARGFGDK